MESKPLVTYAGDENLFGSLQNGIIQGLPLESIEWRRSYGRAPKTVFVEAQFIPFSEDVLPNEDNWTLIGIPFFHTFWTDCGDIDQYKSTVKEDITQWLNKLKARHIQDWMIVLVESMDSKRGGKAKLLPRASVVDKVKNDFCSKQQDRCIALLDPLKSDARGAESWQGLLQRMRQLILQSYNRNLSRFEEYMRNRREKRNEADWSFSDYFVLQEELAFVFEMLGIYDEALVQYDELDALFTQFVINSNLGDTPEWLLTFSKPCKLWIGLSLEHSHGADKRELIRSEKASLLFLRNYLFSRQCALLLLLFRPWEVAQRSLPFMHNCINELQILEVKMPPGAVACWVFLSCLEILHTCGKYNDSSHVETYSLYTAGLWAYARMKLQELGHLCGLMPDMEPTSTQLHHVVELVAGMGVDHNLEDATSPLAKLKEALSSKDAFQRNYLELSELAMGTFKHIGRIRSARLIGRDLADFYMKLNKPHKAAAFLYDAMKMYQEERWFPLLAQTQKELIRCYEAMEDRDKFIKMSLQAASSLVLPEDERIKYFDQVLKKMEELEDQNENLLLNMNGVFTILDAQLVSSDTPVITVDTEVKVQLQILSHLPKTLACETVIAALKFSEDSEPGKEVVNLKEDRASRTRTISNSSCGTQDVEFNSKNSAVSLELGCSYKYTQDRTLSSAMIVCHNAHVILKHQDKQSGLQRERNIVKEEFNLSHVASDVELKPGINNIVVSSKAEAKGEYMVTQLLIQCGRLEFVLPQINVALSYFVGFEVPTVSFTRQCQGELLAGIPQEMKLVIYSGSLPIKENAQIKLEASPGLLLQEVKNNGIPKDEMASELDCYLAGTGSFSTSHTTINVLAELGHQKDASAIKAKLKILFPLIPEPIEINLQFLPPFMAIHKLHTANVRKFIQISVHGLTKEHFELRDHNLSVITNENAAEIGVVPLNALDQVLVVCHDQTAWYMWELVSNLMDCPTLELEFSLSYQRRIKDQTLKSEPRIYKYKFELSNHKTLFTVQSKVEPKGSEFCRTGNMCYMHIQICRVNASLCSSLMYEVLADQTSWAVCGRTAGVVSMDSSPKHNVVLDVMPLTSGFLPLPTVRLSKYIPADQKPGVRATDSPKHVDAVPGGFGLPRLEPFCQGQVYNWSEALQVHVIPTPSSNTADINVP